MEDKCSIGSISKCVCVSKNEYVGPLVNNQRQGRGKETWKCSNCQNYQKYNGKFVQDSLHGCGEYTWKANGEKVVYTGLFYSSAIEGYGQMTQSDSSVFEGLFKNNTRFGPGVLTYPSGSQDVGLWYGNNLIRLCKTVKPEWVPKIATSSIGKMKLLMYKKLIKICNNGVDYAQSVLTEILANDDVMKHSNKLYNNTVRNRKSLFFNHTLYDDDYFLNTDCFIQIASPCDYFGPEDGEDDQYMRVQRLQESLENTIQVLHMVEEHRQKCECELSNTKNLTSKSLSNWAIELIPEFGSSEEKSDNCDINQPMLGECSTASKELFAEEDSTEDLQLQEDNSVLCPLQKQRQKCECNISEMLVTKQLNKLKSRFPSNWTISDSSGNEEKSDEFEIDKHELTASKKILAAENTVNVLKTTIEELTRQLSYEKAQLHLQTSPTAKTSALNKQILVTDLLAWNNEDLSIEIMKYAFLHRNFERNMSYCVADLLSGIRSEFSELGQYESDCIAFLSECSKGNLQKVKDLLLKYDLNPDLCDAKGNTGIIYAAARDRCIIIKTMVNFGGNVDVFTDECFTPLSMCLTRYLAVQNDVTNWEDAFLKPTSLLVNQEETEKQQWRPHVSLLSICDSRSSKCSLKSQNTSNVKFFLEDLDINSEEMLNNQVDPDLQEQYVQKPNGQPQPFILRTDCIKLPPEKGMKEGAKPKKGKSDRKLTIQKEDVVSKKKGTKDNLNEAPKHMQIDQTPDDLLMKKKLRAIHDTIITLLQCGADPNLCEMPMPGLLLAIFTRNLVLIEDLLLKNANPDSKTTDEELTGIHILVSLSPSEQLNEIMKLLLKYSANPNHTTSSQHWPEEKKVLTADRNLLTADTGKTPLHILAMRYDFEADHDGHLLNLAATLLQSGALVNKFYLGHNALSLAILRGNTKLVKLLLEIGKANPNQILQEEMGVPLTVLILKRYENLPSFATCEEVIQMLIEYEANPFNTTGEHGNLMEFIYKEYEEPPKPETKKKRKDKPKNTNKGKKGLVTVQDQVKNLLEKVTQNVLEKHIKGRAVKNLYNFVEEQDYHGETFESMAKFVSVYEIVDIAQSLFHRGEIRVNPEKNYNTMYDLIEFKARQPISSNVDIAKLLENFEFKKLPQKTLQPQVDKHEEKYKVCFNCYKKINCQLFECPKCHLVYFCSEKCNLLNNGRKVLTHHCNVVFYNDQKAAWEEALKHSQRQSQDVESLTKLNKELRLSRQGETAANRHVESLTKLNKELRLARQGETAANRHVETDSKRRLHLTRLGLKGRIEKSSDPYFQSQQRPSLIADRVAQEKKIKKQKELERRARKYDLANTRNDPKISEPKTPSKLYNQNLQLLRHKLSRKYQCFFEKLAIYWPDFDLSTLFLPYACYSDGQLYYRFSGNEPIFGETYSIV